MYRNIFYNPRKGTIKLFTWNDVGDRTEVDYPFKPYVYVESASFKDATSIFNTSLRKIEFKNQFERRRYVQESGIKRIFYNIPVEQQFLIDQFGVLNSDTKFSQYPLKIFYIDIETYSPGKFPEPKLAEDPVNLITIKDSLTNEYHTWGLGKKYTGKKDVNYYQCINETELLRKFINHWTKDYPDIVTGWNSESFDIPYLINRITKLLGEDWVKKLSPVGNIYSRDGILKRFGKVESKWYIKGVSLLDYMECYRTFSRDQRESYSLDNIASDELGEGKLEFEGNSLSKLADTDWDTFVDYNIRDVDLVDRFEEKLRFLQLCRMLGYMGLTPFEGSLGTIAIVTGAMSLAAQQKGMIIPTFTTSHMANYAGGYVKEPQRGLKEGIVSFDANSLYPNTIITLNISPETKLGKITAKTETDVTILLVSGKEYTLPLAKFVDFVKKEQIAISKAKTLYSQKSKGFCPELVEKIYSDRVANKNNLKEHKIAIKHCKEGSEKYIEHKEMINHLDIMQYTLKILMNRIYGTFANKHSPFCDVDAASSITLTGQACVKQASDIVNNFVKSEYGIDEKEDLNIYSDTDSVVGNTIIRTSSGALKIEDMFDSGFIENEKVLNTPAGHELVKPKNDLKCLTYNSKTNFVELKNIKNIIRHCVSKKKYKIKVNGKEIIMTEDHGCMVLRNDKLIRVSPKEIKNGDKMINIYSDTAYEKGIGINNEKTNK